MPVKLALMTSWKKEKGKKEERSELTGKDPLIQLSDPPPCSLSLSVSPRGFVLLVSSMMNGPVERNSS